MFLWRKIGVNKDHQSIHTNTRTLMYPKTANPNTPRCVGFAVRRQNKIIINSA